MNQEAPTARFFAVVRGWEDRALEAFAATMRSPPRKPAAEAFPVRLQVPFRMDGEQWIRAACVAAVCVVVGRREASFPRSLRGTLPCFHDAARRHRAAWPVLTGVRRRPGIAIGRVSSFRLIEKLFQKSTCIKDG